MNSNHDYNFLVFLAGWTRGRFEREPIKLFWNWMLLFLANTLRVELSWDRLLGDPGGLTKLSADFKSKLKPFLVTSLRSTNCSEMSSELKESPLLWRSDIRSFFSSDVVIVLYFWLDLPLLDLRDFRDCRELVRGTLEPSRSNNLCFSSYSSCFFWLSCFWWSSILFLMSSSSFILYFESICFVVEWFTGEKNLMALFCLFESCYGFTLWEQAQSVVISACLEPFFCWWEKNRMFLTTLWSMKLAFFW